MVPPLAPPLPPPPPTPPTSPPPGGTPDGVPLTEMGAGPAAGALRPTGGSAARERARKEAAFRLASLRSQYPKFLNDGVVNRWECIVCVIVGFFFLPMRCEMYDEA